jgi:threonine synthase
MKFYSLNKQSPIVGFKEAAILGQAPDKGLYFPELIPRVDDELIRNIESISNEEIAFRVIQPYVGNAIKEEELFNIVKETINFPFPLVKVNDSISSLELFHGPTLAFKDVGARFMSRCLEYFIKNDPATFARKNKVTVLVATSGDTGGAVANGFNEVDGIEVVILYPSGKVSQVQEKQLTTNGKNIHALEVEGTFDDCQQIVKKAFADDQLNQQLYLTSANSINVARWLPQQFYYFFAYKQWREKDRPPIISVPSGNFGNICAGLLAHASGLPVKHFIAACNANNIVPEFLKSETYKPKKAVATLSNAMDVGDPSNFVRVMEIFHQHIDELRSKLSSYSITDTETATTIKKIYDQHGYTADPHGAVGYAALEKYLQQHPKDKGIFLETAHPVKFIQPMEEILKQKIELPAAIAGIMSKQCNSVKCKADYELVKSFLLSL